MLCTEFQERLLEYDGLAAGERVTVDEHLAGCADCTAFYAVIHEIDTALTAAFADRRVSSIFTSRVSQELRVHRVPRPSMVPEILDATGWAGIVGIMLWLATFFVPGLEFSIPLAIMIGTILLIAGFWVAFRCYADLRRS